MIPGWYPDPHDSGRQIYWDGEAWDVPAAARWTAPPQPPTPPASKLTAATQGRRRTWWFVPIAVILLGAAMWLLLMPLTPRVDGRSVSCGTPIKALSINPEDPVTKAMQADIDAFESGRGPSHVDVTHYDRVEAAAEGCHGTARTRIIVGGVLALAAIAAAVWINSWEVARARIRI